MSTKRRDYPAFACGNARALSRNGDAAPHFAQRYAAAIPWQDLRAAERVLEETNAFVTPEEASDLGARLILPRDVVPGP